MCYTETALNNLFISLKMKKIYDIFYDEVPSYHDLL